MIQFQENMLRKSFVLPYAYCHLLSLFFSCVCKDAIDFYSNDTLSSAYPVGHPACEPGLKAGPFLHKVWRSIGHLVLTSTGTMAHQRTSWECCTSCTSQQHCNPHPSFFLIYVTIVLTSCSSMGIMCKNKASQTMNHLW